jgi:hypothetical protein
MAHSSLKHSQKDSARTMRHHRRPFWFWFILEWTTRGCWRSTPTKQLLLVLVFRRNINQLPQFGTI